MEILAWPKIWRLVSTKRKILRLVSTRRQVLTDIVKISERVASDNLAGPAARASVWTGSPSYGCQNPSCQRHVWGIRQDDDVPNLDLLKN